MQGIHSTVMKYIYIDESGDLGNSHSSSKHFVMGAIVVEDPRSLKKIIKKVKRSNKNHLHKASEVKRNKTDKHIIEKIADLISWSVFQKAEHQKFKIH